MNGKEANDQAATGAGKPGQEEKATYRVRVAAFERDGLDAWTATAILNAVGGVHAPVSVEREGGSHREVREGEPGDWPRPEDRDLAIWYTPDAIRDHFEDDEETLEGVEDADLREAARVFIEGGNDPLWEDFDRACHDIVADAREIKQDREERQGRQARARAARIADREVAAKPEGAQ